MQSTLLKMLTAFLLLLGLTAISAEAAQLSGCFENKNGKLRLVHGPEACKNSETFVTWNSEGPAGPQGLPGIDGLDGFVVYAIGDIGPAGGWVFYVTNDGLHGLEAAPVDQALAEWGCFGTDISGATSTAIGAGARNTDDIVRGCPTAGIAAAVADEYISPSGYIDWYLPSKDELNEMHLNIGQGSMTIGNVGGFASNLYWSSSETVDDVAWDQDFTNGAQGGDYFKYNIFGVRAIRAF